MTPGSRPTVDPRWAHDGTSTNSSYIKTPTSPNQDEGFPPGTQPPAGWMDWLFNLIYLWIMYFKGAHGIDINIAPADGYSPTSASGVPVIALGGAVASSSGSASGWETPLKQPSGTIINSITSRVFESNAGGETVTLKLWNYPNGEAGSGVQLGDSIVSGVTGTTVDHLWRQGTNDPGGDFPYTVGANDRLVLESTFVLTGAIIFKNIHLVRE